MLLPDERESAFAVWYEDLATKREMEIVSRKIPGLTEFQRIVLALQMQILVAVNVYGDDDLPGPITGSGQTGGDDEDEPWKRGKSDPDSTGFSP